MPKKLFSDIVAFQQKIDPISCGTALTLRLPGLGAFPSMRFYGITKFNVR